LIRGIEKKLKMVKRCVRAGCERVAIYGESDLRVRKYCLEHRLFGMVNLLKRVRCCRDGCNFIGNYGHPGFSHRRFCIFHKVGGMIFLKD
jgi:hypothetical protein